MGGNPNAGGGVMERLSSRTGVAEVLAIVCLVGVVVVGATLALRNGFPGVAAAYSDVQLTSFVR